MAEKFDLNEEKFKALLNDEISKITSEDTRQIILDAMKQYLIDENNIKNLLVTCDSWGNKKPSYLLESTINKIDFKEEFNEVTNTIKEYLKKDENIEKLMKSLFMDTLLNGMNNIIWGSSFRDSIKDEIKSELFKNRY